LPEKLPEGFHAPFFLQWERLTELGLVKDKGDRISLTEKGILFSNEVF